jgi:hypothetical protein
VYQVGNEIVKSQQKQRLCSQRKAKSNKGTFTYVNVHNGSDLGQNPFENRDVKEEDEDEDGHSGRHDPKTGVKQNSAACADAWVDKGAVANTNIMNHKRRRDNKIV